jgi:hypothetical protein
MGLCVEGGEVTVTSEVDRMVSAGMEAMAGRLRSDVSPLDQDRS